MKRAFALCLCLLLCVSALWFSVPAKGADLGSYSGDSDYGGGYDFDFGSDYGSDYDYGSSYSSGGDGVSIWGVLLAVVIIVIVFSVAKKKKGRGPVAPGAQRTPLTSLRPMTDYAALDPQFDGADLTEKLSNRYVQMQNAWTAGDLEPLRPYFTDALYAQLDRQLAGLKQRNQTNYVDRIAVLGVDLLGYLQRDGEDHLIVQMRTRIVDYTMDNATHKVVSGDQRAERFMTYEWDLSRPTGTLTAAEAEMSKVNCPNCGAPLTINQSCRCPYCDTVVTLEKHDWAICAIRGISQATA